MTGTAARASIDALVPVLAAALLCAGLAKMAVPGAARAAVAELVPRAAPAAGLAARVLAVAEIAAAAALLSPRSRVAGAVAVTVLGVLFGGAGLVGRARHATAPCGCFGTAGGAPLGWRNVAAGLLVSGMGLLAWWLSGRAAAAAPAALAGATAIAMCLLVAALHRRMILAAVRPAGPPRPEGARR